MMAGMKRSSRLMSAHDAVRTVADRHLLKWMLSDKNGRSALQMLQSDGTHLARREKVRRRAEFFVCVCVCRPFFQFFVSFPSEGRNGGRAGEKRLFSPLFIPFRFQVPRPALTAESKTWSPEMRRNLRQLFAGSFTVVLPHMSHTGSLRETRSNHQQTQHQVFTFLLLPPPHDQSPSGWW